MEYLYDWENAVKCSGSEETIEGKRVAGMTAIHYHCYSLYLSL